MTLVGQMIFKKAWQQACMLILLIFIIYEKQNYLRIQFHNLLETVGIERAHKTDNLGLFNDIKQEFISSYGPNRKQQN